tara:strand:+ start:130 stop:1077 length:948 start_codon:yes stop_codon:yes gene_type:complete
MTNLFSKHGGKLDSVIDQYGGKKSEWLDLSTGINPTPYPFKKVDKISWNRLPDDNAFASLYKAARNFWGLPKSSHILGASGVSSLIALIPFLQPFKTVSIQNPTYSEYELSFKRFGCKVVETGGEINVVVNPNNPDGKIQIKHDVIKNHKKVTIIDESFCDLSPENSLLDLADHPGIIVLKSFGKFWGLAGLRLGFAIGTPQTISPVKDVLGPWQISGPALAIGHQALTDTLWAKKTRLELAKSAIRLDLIMNDYKLVGGTNLYRLYHAQDSHYLTQHLASHKILVRNFDYNKNWVRIGIPGQESDWERLDKAIK